MSCSVLIPTYNRPDDLQRCLDSILTQDVLPAEILIIDDGDLMPDIQARLATRVGGQGIRWAYRKKDHTHERRGLSESKNIGLSLVSEPLCCIFDDDVVLEPGFLRAVLAPFAEDNSPQLIAVGGVIVNSRQISRVERVFNALFGLVGTCAWDVNESGFQVWDDAILQRQRGYYTHGGVCVVRVSVARQFPFRVFHGGRTALEDVTFYAEAKKAGHYVYVEPQARLVHNEAPVSRDREALVGYKESANRCELFGILHPIPTNRQRAAFARAVIGWILRQVLAGHWQKAWGMVQGLRNKALVVR
ncbi:MAG: glycosyltransferase family 2 protein [Candidatus Doudnabacteria bacterium]|nr:glycosyltransferase family 2 protein [Candidatus Doudnabacteria bacterium]